MFKMVPCLRPNTGSLVPYRHVNSAVLQATENRR